VAHVWPFPVVLGARRCARAKELLEANENNACGRRLLLEGILKALLVLSHLKWSEKPYIRFAGSDSGGTSETGVVPTLEALSRSLTDFRDRQD
jgi:hypothetical protein